jgi:hypothetical protein
MSGPALWLKRSARSAQGPCVRVSWEVPWRYYIALHRFHLYPRPSSTNIRNPQRTQTMPDSQEQNGLRLLSLGAYSDLPLSDLPILKRSFIPSDGGGIRGLSELLILQEIMRRIQHDEKLAEMPSPCDYFDLIGGTSTGGYVIRNILNLSQPDTQTPSRIIALMLGRLQMSVPEAIIHYGTLAKRVFSSTKLIGRDGKFRASKLEEVIKEIAEERLGDPDAPMMDPRPEGKVCKT